MAGRSELDITAQGRVFGTTLECSVHEKLRTAQVDGGKRKEWVSSRTTASYPRRRYVYIIQVDGQVWVFSHCGTSCRWSWPTIRENVEAKRRWIVLVVDGYNGEAVTRDMLIGATYFDCPADRVLSQTPSQIDVVRIVGRVEAVEPVGWTVAGNAAIEEQVRRLSPYWAISDSIIWNSQYFALHLAALILTPESFNTKKPDFIALSRGLYCATHNAEGEFIVTKHLCCMAGMAVSGALTFGVGALVFWAGAGASMGRAGYVGLNVNAQMHELQKMSGRFRVWAWIGG